MAVMSYVWEGDREQHGRDLNLNSGGFAPPVGPEKFRRSYIQIGRKTNM